MTNDCLIPELSIAETAPLGKWGLLRKHYLIAYRIHFAHFKYECTQKFAQINSPRAKVRQAELRRGREG